MDSFNKKSWKKILIVVMLLTLVISNIVFAEPVSISKDSIDFIGNEYHQYLDYKYGIKISNTITKGDFINWVAKILDGKYDGKDNKFEDIDKDNKYYKSSMYLYEKGILDEGKLEPNKELTTMEGISIAIKASNLKELALSYPETKVFETLKKVNFNNKNKYAQEELQYIVAAIDTGLLPVTKGQFKLEDKIDEKIATLLLGKIVSFNGEYKNYLGYVSDENIYNKINKAWESFDLIDAKELRTIVDSALRKDIITGYNLKDIRYNPNFIPELTITYGHSDLIHAIQLVGLLRSENIDAKIQLEPKTSAFIYLKEWGKPIETPDYKVRQIENGNYIAYSKEYDISFEFNTKAEKERFNHIILNYAKKNEENPKGVLYGSWWQPLYSSKNKLDGYREITNNYIIKDNYLAQSFTTNQDSLEVIKGFNKVNSDVKVMSYKFWVNEAFYGYLVGEDYK